MNRSVARASVVGLLTLAVCGIGQIVYIVAICPPHRAWVRARHDAQAVVLDSGEGVARPGDAIFVCETPHRLGPIVFHEDLACYCAPASISQHALSDAVLGRCTLDKPNPSRADAWGACRYARCAYHENF
jgi:hypothetical protein